MLIIPIRVSKNGFPKLLIVLYIFCTISNLQISNTLYAQRLTLEISIHYVGSIRIIKLELLWKSKDKHLIVVRPCPRSLATKTHLLR